MKKLITLFCLLFSVGLSAQSRVINKPFCELHSGGIDKITKIEITKESTLVTLNTTFIPGWWIMINRSTFIQDSDTGEKLFIESMEGGEFDTEIRMPESGESTFILKFPALNKNTKRINYGDKDNTTVWGISLDKKRSGAVAPSKEIPQDVVEWINAEVAKSQRQTPANLTSVGDFFSGVNARIVGYFKGYDERLNFSTGIIHYQNVITREDQNALIQIEPDGRFTADINLAYPSYAFSIINSQFLQFYIEPGQTLGLVIDWADFLQRDRYRNTREDIRPLQFFGPLARINQEILGTDIANKEYKPAELKLSVEEHKVEQIALFKDKLAQLDALAKSKDLLPQTALVLKSRIINDHAVDLMEYPLELARSQTDQYAEALRIADSLTPENYFDFLKDIPMNDHTLLIPSGSWVLVNRFEYLTKFMSQGQVTQNSKPEMSFVDYLTKVKNVVLDEEDMEYVNFLDSISSGKIATNDENSQKESILGTQFIQKYITYYKAYSNKYLYIGENSRLNSCKRNWNHRDSVLLNDFGLEYSFIYDITKVRSLQYELGDMEKDDARVFLSYIERNMTSPYAVSQAEQLYYKIFKPQAVDQTYELPAGKAAEILRKIIDPFKGKQVVIDFWSTGCGPCLYTIMKSKEDRALYKDSDEIVFVFITDTGSSPQQRYDEVVQENELIHSYRLTESDSNYLEALFNISAIPHSVLIDKQGRVADDNFGFGFSKSEIQRLISK